jgi:hypothetical protein
MTIEEFVIYIEYFMIIVMGIQVIYALAFLVFGDMMVSYFEWGYFEKPETLFQKITNLICLLTMGAGYFINKRLQRYSWVVNKLLFIIVIPLISIAFIIIFQVVSYLLRLMI